MCGWMGGWMDGQTLLLLVGFFSWFVLCLAFTFVFFNFCVAK